MADPLFDMLGALAALVETVPGLKNRVGEAADLSELLRKGGMPNRAASAWVIPAGLRPRGQGDAGTGYFIQSIDEHFAVVLALTHAGDLSGGKSLPRLNELVWAVVAAVCGGDVDDAVGVFRLIGGNIVGLNAGLITYQLEFAIQLQLRKI